MMLVLMSVGTSIDAQAVGLSLALSGSSIFWPSLTISLVAAAMTYIGLRLSCELSALLGHPMEFIGGLVLLFIGTRVLASHLTVLP